MDRDYGEWAGVPRQDVIDRWGSVDDAPGVEPQQTVRARAVDGLSAIARRCSGLAAVVVSHDAVTRQVLMAFDPGLGDADELPQDNAVTTRWNGTTAPGPFSMNSRPRIGAKKSTLHA